VQASRLFGQRLRLVRIMPNLRLIKPLIQHRQLLLQRRKIQRRLGLFYF